MTMAACEGRRRKGRKIISHRLTVAPPLPFFHPSLPPSLPPYLAVQRKEQVGNVVSQVKNEEDHHLGGTGGREGGGGGGGEVSDQVNNVAEEGDA
jgi:hypothetical protein